VRMIRDPRDVLISAVRYHLTTDAQWVNQPRGRFGGQTLKAALTALPDLESRLLYEIKHVIGNALERMESFERGSVFKDIRYEDLVADRGLQLTLSMLDYLGFESDVERLVGCIAMWQNSLFGALAREGNAHINDGSGRQHEAVMSPRVRDAFHAQFGDAAQRMGYDGGDARAVLSAQAGHTSSPLVHDFVATLGTTPAQGGLPVALARALAGLAEPGPLLVVGAEVSAEAGDIALAAERAAAALRWPALPEAQIGAAVHVLVRAEQAATAVDLLQSRHAGGDHRESLYLNLAPLLARDKARQAFARVICAEGLTRFPEAAKLRALQSRIAA
jgi:hypothetical protein